MYQIQTNKTMTKEKASYQRRLLPLLVKHIKEDLGAHQFKNESDADYLETMAWAGVLTNERLMRIQNYVIREWM